MNSIIADAGLSSTPAMYMSTIFQKYNYDGDNVNRKPSSIIAVMNEIFIKSDTRKNDISIYYLVLK